MEPKSLPTEIIISHSRQSLGKVQLDWNPQPGALLELNGHTYAVLERRHRYQFLRGRYQLQAIALYVQTAQAPTERSLMAGQWVIGNATCRYNARSEMVRCAVHPSGPCEGCRWYEPAESS